MANKRRSNGQKSGYSPNKFNGFLNIFFNDKEKVEVNSWIDSRNLSAYDSLICIAERGWKVSISYDAGKDVWSCSITGKQTSTIYDGYCVVSTHKDSEKVIFVAQYVVEVLLENQAVPLPGDASDLDW